MPTAKTDTTEKLKELLALLQSAACGFGSLHNSETDKSYAFTSSLAEIRQAMEIVECLIKQ